MASAQDRIDRVLRDAERDQVRRMRFGQHRPDTMPLIRDAARERAEAVGRVLGAARAARHDGPGDKPAAGEVGNA